MVRVTTQNSLIWRTSHGLFSYKNHCHFMKTQYNTTKIKL